MNMATVGRREDFDRVRPAKSELMKPMVEPPEVISVEMTPEEQDVYALMGVSPLVLTDRSVKNPKNAIVSVTLPVRPRTSRLSSSSNLNLNRRRLPRMHRNGIIIQKCR